METHQQIHYRRALEALRNGVPNRHAVGVLGTNQLDAEKIFCDRLDTAEDAAEEGRQVPGLIVSGGFGAGKSHLLDYLEHLAVSRNFVSSRVVISKETPLFDPAKMLLAALDNAVVPGVSGEAVREIAARLEVGSLPYTRFVDWANRPNNGLSPIFPATLRLHEKLHNDPGLVDEITSFWSGEPMPISRIRAGLKQINSAGSFILKAVKLKDLAIQRFLFASRLMLAAGYSGWVLLIDELELVGRYSLLQRGKSYAELARWMGKVKGEMVPGLFSVGAITDDYGAAVLQGKSDRDLVGTKMRAKDTDEYNTIAGRAETGMRLIEREALTLRKPDHATLQQTYDRIKEIHAKAYSWDPPEIPWAAAAKTREMRSYVRRWVNEWDLKRLYPDAEISTDDVQEIRLSYESDPLLELEEETS